MLSSRTAAVVGAVAALVVAVVAVIESAAIRAWLNSEAFREVSNGDLLSVLQLFLLFFVYREVRHVQQALMGRGSDRK